MSLEIGSILEGKVTGITKFGAFVEFKDGATGMVHISEVASTYVKEISDHLTEGQQVKVKVINISDDGKVNLSIKKAQEPEKNTQKRPPRRENNFNNNSNRSSSKNEPLSFEDMMNKFKQSSDERMSDLKRSIDSKRGSYSKRGSRSPK